MYLFLSHAIFLLKRKDQDKFGNNTFPSCCSGLVLVWPCCAEMLSGPGGVGRQPTSDIPRPYLQSVKKTWAARYLAVGGSLKSLMRERTDCRGKKREMNLTPEVNGTYIWTGLSNYVPEMAGDFECIILTHAQPKLSSEDLK